VALIPLLAPICRYLFVHLRAHEARKGHSYCSQQGCERIKIMAHMYPGDSWSCDPNPFTQRPAAARHPMSQRPAGPCRACGAPQVRVTPNSISGYAVRVHPREVNPFSQCMRKSRRICLASCNLRRGKGFSLNFCSFLYYASKIASKELPNWKHVNAHSLHLFPPFLSFKQ